MILIGIAGFISIVIIIAYFLNRGEILEAVGRCFGILCLAIMINFCIAIISDSWDNDNFERGELIETIKITAFKDSNNFITHSNNTKYSYVKETENGKTIKTINSHRVYFPDNYNGEPYIEVYNCKRKEGNKWTIFPVQTKEYVIYIPEGSIVSEYEVDLQ